MLDIILSLAAGLILLIATTTDLIWREVPDWLNYAGIATGLGIRLIYAIGQQDARIITDGVLGFLIFLILALLMYYLGQWGGGDSKLLMALGALIGVDFTLHGTMIAFLFNLLLVGGTLGLLWCCALALRNKKTFLAAYRPLWSHPHFILTRRISYAITTIILLITIFLPDLLLKLALTTVALALLFTVHTTIFIKAVEQCCMFKRIPPSALTEGDWIAEDVLVGKKCILSHKTLGVTREQIAQLVALHRHGKLKTVLIKIGIPFVPSFLLAFIATKLWGNLLLALTS